MRYKTLILDFDGTLADTQKSIIETMKVVAEHFSLNSPDEALIKSLIGLPLKTTFERALALDESFIPEATRLYRAHYNEIAIDTISLFEGVETTLTGLHQKGINLTVGSSKGKESLNRILKKQGVLELFSFVGGEEDVKHKKPSPELVQLIIDAHQSSPEECLVVGDTTFDIEMGQSAQIDTCGVTYGAHTREQLESQKPDYLIDRFSHLMGIV